MRSSSLTPFADSLQNFAELKGSNTADLASRCANLSKTKCGVKAKCGCAF